MSNAAVAHPIGYFGQCILIVNQILLNFFYLLAYHIALNSYTFYLRKQFTQMRIIAVQLLYNQVAVVLVTRTVSVVYQLNDNILNLFYCAAPSVICQFKTQFT